MLSIREHLTYADHFTDEELEAQRGNVTCLRSHGMTKAALRFDWQEFLHKLENREIEIKK